MLDVATLSIIMMGVILLKVFLLSFTFYEMSLCSTIKRVSTHKLLNEE